MGKKMHRSTKVAARTLSGTRDGAVQMWVDDDYFSYLVGREVNRHKVENVTEERRCA